MLPPSIRAQLDASKASIHRFQDGLPADPSSLALVQDVSGSMRRLVLVGATDDENKLARIMLVTNEADMATDLDLILDPSVTGYPTTLVAQAELYGTVFIEQLSTVVGRLPLDLYDAISSSLLSDGESLHGLPVGLPLHANDDGRREFKHDELAELQQLEKPCQTFLSHAPCPDIILSPALLLPPPPGTPKDIAAEQFVELLDAFDYLAEHDVSVLEILALLDESDLRDDLPRWWTEFGFDRRPFTLDRTAKGRDIDKPLATISEELRLDSSLEPAAKVTLALIDLRANLGVPTVDLITNDVWGEIIIRPGANGGYCRARPRALEPA